MAPIKVLYISYSFPPVNAAASFRALKLTNGLHDHDIHCTVITRNEIYESHVHRNSEKGLVKKIDSRTSVLRARYFSPTIFQPIFSIVNFLKHFKGKNQQGIGTQSDPFIPDHYIEWIPLAFLKAISHARTNDADIIYASGPPLSVLVLGYMLKLALKVPLVVEYRDKLTDDPYTKSNVFKSAVNKLIEKFILKRSDAVISVSGPIVDDLISKHGLEKQESKFHVIPSAYDPEDFKNVVPLDNGKKFTLALTTSLYGDRDPTVLFKALAFLKRAGKATRDNFSLDIYGYNDERRFAAILDALGISDIVNLKGFVSHSECIAAMKGSTFNLDVGESNFDYPTIPYHFWEYVGSGKMILHLGRRRDYKASFVRNNLLGIVLPIDNAMETAITLYTRITDHENGMERHLDKGYMDANTWKDRIDKIADVIQRIDGKRKFKPFPFSKISGVMPGRYVFNDDYVGVYTG